MNPCDDQSVNILRYLDNELSGRELEDFSAHLKVCANCMASLEEERALSHLLHGSRPLYSAPASLSARVSAALNEHSALNRPPVRLYERVLRILRWPLRDAAPCFLSWKVLAPAVLAIVLFIAFAPEVMQRVRAASYVATAVAVHRSYLYSNLAPQIRSDSPEVVTAWFADKVPFHFRLPASQSDLDSKPVYRLTGASLVDYEGSHAALVSYETKKEKISLLVASSQSAVVAGGDEIHSGDLTFHYRSDEDFKVITWANHGLSYALVSSISASARESCLVCHQNMADHDDFRPHL